MGKFKVYISDYDYPDLDIERSILEPIGAEVIGLQCKSGQGLVELASDADAILQQYAKIPRETIIQLKKCKAICRYGIGTDIVDVKAAYEHGMVVTNVPDYCLDEVADHTITLSLMLIRRIPMYTQATKNGYWHWSYSNGPVLRLRGMIWGLVGFGRIAQNLANKLQAFGIQVIAYDPYLSHNFIATHSARKVELDELISSAAVINLMCPYTKETHHIIDEQRLHQMKKEAVLVNCSRGKLIDNNALYKALSEGWIASAGLDDLEEEPAKTETWSSTNNPIFTLQNCFVTPHVGYVSVDSLLDCRHVAAENARAVLLGLPPLNPVKP